MKHCTIAGPFPVLADLQEGINSDLVGITEGVEEHAGVGNLFLDVEVAE